MLWLLLLLVMTMTTTNNVEYNNFKDDEYDEAEDHADEDDSVNAT